jgi:serine/threonine protein kinase/HAMP domain-containing protein
MVDVAAPQPAQQEKSGRSIGRYQVMARIGQGAMAHVYRARDPEIQRDLAIKILNQQLRRDPECVSRFLREARAAGSLSHPNIVTIYDVGEAQELPYLAMELLGGQPLDKVIEERGAFSILEVLHIGIQLADALQYAHELGIVHRDVKPSNIMLGADGRTIKLLDFGIARVAEPSGPDAAAQTLKTQIGQVLGTPRYMSPEQALGQQLDGRSDLFSVGAILYELVCGRPAFNGTSVATLAVQIATQHPDPIDVIPECPRGLRFIIDKLLSKAPEKRFSSGAKVVEALKREIAACNAAAADDRGRRLPLHFRFTLLASAVVFGVLTLGMSWVIDQQYRAMERVAVTSGSSIAAFVGTNASLHLMENATRPAAEADWLPVRAFVQTAAGDANITNLMVVDGAGIVQAAANPDAVGAFYSAPAAQRMIGDGLDVGLSSVRGPEGEKTFRFTRPITYAGRLVGQVDVSMRNDQLQSSARLTSTLLVAFGVLMMAVVLGLSFLAGRAVLGPVRRLNAALKEAASGRFDFRISHNRRDEFGELFDGFNTLAVTMQDRIEQGAVAEPAATPLDAAIAALQSSIPATAKTNEATETILMGRRA